MINFKTVIKMNENEIFNMYFGIIEDPRCEVNVIHPLIDILKLVMIAVLCGMDELDKIIDYGKNKKEFFDIICVRQIVIALNCCRSGRLDIMSRNI